jgi:ribosomal protein S18 acetylase RimI-like enzyme
MIVRDQPPGIQIVDYRPDLAAAFECLNREWIEQYFRMEPLDEALLSDPEGLILDGGGVILFAVINDGTVGTCALKREGRRYELTKMAVAPAAQGAGIGRALLNAAIERFRALDGEQLWLETAPVLEAAVRLYESAGFIQSEAPRPSEYRRCEIYMVHQQP